MAREGGGGGSFLGVATGLIGAIIRGVGGRTAPSTPAQRAMASIFTPGPSQASSPMLPPGAARNLPASRAGVFHSTQPGSPQPAPSSTAGDFLDAAARGLQRGFQLLDLVEYLKSLFRKPPKVGGFYTQTEVIEMPYLLAPTGSMQMGGTDWVSGLSNLAGGISSIIAGIRGAPQTMPGGSSSFLPAVIGAMGGRVGAAAAVGLAGSAFYNWLTEPSNGMDKPFAAAGGRASARMFVVPNPETGRPTWFRPAGRPLLWSGDLAAVKKVHRVARLARRRSGGR